MAGGEAYSLGQWRCGTFPSPQKVYCTVGEVYYIIKSVRNLAASLNSALKLNKSKFTQAVLFFIIN